MATQVLPALIGITVGAVMLVSGLWGLASYRERPEGPEPGWPHLLMGMSVFILLPSLGGLLTILPYLCGGLVFLALSATGLGFGIWSYIRQRRAPGVPVHMWTYLLVALSALMVLSLVGVLLLQYTNPILAAATVGLMVAGCALAGTRWR